MSIDITKIWAWIKTHIIDGIIGIDKVAITVTEDLKSALNNGTVGFIASVLDSLTKSGVPTAIVNFLNANLPKALAVELAIQGLPANPTQADILTFEQAVLAAFNVTSSKSKVYSSLAAQIYGMLQAQNESGTKFTFAVLVNDVEAAYQDYLTDSAA